MIIIENAFKKFKDTPVIQGVSFNIDKGTILGLAGPSGGGKSTMLRCIQKFDTLDKGKITCLGTTGFMFQDFQLFPHMTVLENLTYAPKLLGYDVRSRANELLVNLGLESKSNNYPISLSGGQKQRVAFARSLMMNPDIFLCDEPTSGLDVATIEDVVVLLKSLQITTMVIASHDLDFLMKITTRIIILNKGKIVKDIETKSTDINELKTYYG